MAKRKQNKALVPHRIIAELGLKLAKRELAKKLINGKVKKADKPLPELDYSNMDE